MNVLLSLLQKSTDYNQLLKAVEAKQAVAVSGLSQAPRSHVLAAAHEQSGRPLVAVCQDDMAAKRLASELGAFLGEEPPVLPSRELTLAGAIGVSRQWEQQRLRLLYALAQGRVPVLVASLDALLLRTLPRQTLFSASVTLRVGAEYSMPELIERLTRAGYSRASLVEGVGQFALRGGILDVYSPAQEKPLRAEFFGDELDTMGYFDPITQRRTENVDEAVLLPVAETEPHLHPQGISGLCEDLRAIIARQQRRKTPNQALIETLQKDCEALENETLFASADRYMALIYPEFTTAASYLPQEAIVAFCDHGNLQRGEKTARRSLASCSIRSWPPARSSASCAIITPRWTIWPRHCAAGLLSTATASLLRGIRRLCRPSSCFPLRPGSCRAMAEVWKQRRLILKITRRTSMAPSSCAADSGAGKF